MNKNFKVVFSKARNALMVVNEVTSSVQTKGTKTVIAAAVAAVAAGAAVATEPVTDTKLTDTDQQIVYTGKDATDEKKLDQYFVTANKDGATVTDKTADVFGKDGKVDVLMRVDEDNRLVISNGAFTNLGSPMKDVTGGRGALVSVAGGNAAITNVTFEGNKFASGLKDDKKTLDGLNTFGMDGIVYYDDAKFGFGTTMPAGGDGEMSVSLRIPYAIVVDGYTEKRIAGISFPNATVNTPGAMTAADKRKLDGIDRVPDVEIEALFD